MADNGDDFENDKDLFDKQFVNIDSDIINTRQNSSLSRANSTALIVYPTENFVGDIDIMIVASDTTGEYAVDTLTLTIVENISPVLATIEDQTTNEDTATSVILSATDIDGDSFTFTASSADTNVITTVSIDTLTLIPAANWNGQSAITVVVTDNGLGTLSDTTTFTFTVNAVNDAPVYTSTSFKHTMVIKNQAYSYSVTTSDVDGDAISLTGTTIPDWLTFTDSGDNTGSLAGTPSNN